MRTFQTEMQGYVTSGTAKISSNSLCPMANNLESRYGGDVRELTLSSFLE